MGSNLCVFLLIPVGFLQYAVQFTVCSNYGC
jgi:hypothetical protein